MTRSAAAQAWATTALVAPSLLPPCAAAPFAPPDHPLFALLLPMGQPLNKPKVAHASQVDAEYTISEKDLQFCAALHRFQCDQTMRLYGLAHMHKLGPGAVKGNNVLKRMIDCACAYKIRDLNGLYRATKWHCSKELGNEVLQLISE